MSVCMYDICMSVCQTITFKSLDVVTHPVELEGIWVKFVYEGHRVKVKVTGAKKPEM